MYLFIANILLLFFGIGALVTLYLNKDSQADRAKARWLKLGVYFLVLSLVFSSIYFEQIKLLAICIGIVGIYEIFKAQSFSKRPVFFFYFILFIYLIILLAFVKFCYQIPTERICFVYFIVVTFDGFSQLSGQLVGKRKLIPKISPNKTFEGLIGGLILAVSASLFLFHYIPFSIGLTVWTAALICIFALIGDLLASWYKRRCQIKDYSRLIPGHGGILDRFDSFMFSGAMYWLVYL
ncbi:MULTISPECIES: phosphatidate cytidylyltransferase [Sphingobacterium]|uniref:phosphatidate cytidylyltransferase n=1 Tax=Sphingobacterium TaxID=28453 RepID=UPI0025806CFF|nr:MULTISPECIES: phosphatidate cytidylyltransferase [Sphingobacterium]